MNKHLYYLDAAGIHGPNATYTTVTEAPYSFLLAFCKYCDRNGDFDGADYDVLAEIVQSWVDDYATGERK